MTTQIPPRSDTKQRVTDLISRSDFRARLKDLLPTIITPERFAAVALGSLTRNPGLLECTPHSLVLCMLQAATVGLEVDSGLGHAYLVPFRDNKTKTRVCTLILGYRGLAQLLYRSAAVAAIEAHVVREGDAFRFRFGLEPELAHVPLDDPERPITHAYAIVRNKDGSTLFDVMSHAEIEKIRGRSRAAAAGPWVTDYAAMACKTVVRRLAKLAPMSVEDQRVVIADERADANLDQADVFDPALESSAALLEIGGEAGADTEAVADGGTDEIPADPLGPPAPADWVEGLNDGKKGESV